MPTIGALISEARQLLNDTIPISGAPRFTDQALVNALNDAMFQVHAKRPDAFMVAMRDDRYSLAPQFSLPADTNVEFPVNANLFYPAVLYYVVGRSELTEDTFAVDNRAVTLMNKFVTQILTVKS